MGIKVLLINPPTPKKEVWVREGRCQQFDIWGAPFPPLSLAYIAGQIKGIARTLIVDCGPSGLDLEKTLEKIKNFNPDLLILSTATPTIGTDLDWFAEEVKSLLPKIKIAVIGIHVTALPEETLKKFSAANFIIRGEPELTAKELVEFLRQDRSDFEKIAGLAFRHGTEIIVNQPREFLENLDQLNFPDWPGVDFKNYKLPILNKPFNLITFARGCPFSCKFCNAHTYYGKIVRKRSPEKIIEEIKYNIENYNIRDFLFWTEFITMDSVYLREFILLLKKENLHKKIRWVSNSRVDVDDLSLFQEMKEAGCWQMAFGLEFGSNQILQLAQKGPRVNVEQSERVIRAASGAGIVTDGHFIMGYPGETEKTLRQTINFAISLPLTFAHFYAATPFPGSELYKEALEKKWFGKDDWTKVSQDIPSLKTAQLDPLVVKSYIAKAYKKFYLRPAAVWRIVKIAKNPQEFFSVAKIGLKFISDIIRH